MTIFNMNYGRATRCLFFIMNSHFRGHELDVYKNNMDSKFVILFLLSFCVLAKWHQRQPDQSLNEKGIRVLPEIIYKNVSHVKIMF